MGNVFNTLSRGSGGSDTVGDDVIDQPETHPLVSMPVPSPTEECPPDTAEGSDITHAVSDDVNSRPETHPPVSVPVPSPTEECPPDTAEGSDITHAVSDDVNNQPETHPPVSVPVPSPTEECPPDTAEGSDITHAVSDDVNSRPETHHPVSVPVPSPTEECPPDTAEGSDITHAVSDDVNSRPETHPPVSVPVPSPTEEWPPDTAEGSNIKDPVCGDDNQSGVSESMTSAQFGCEQSPLEGFEESRISDAVWGDEFYLDEDGNKCMWIHQLPCSLVDNIDVHTLKLLQIDRVPAGVAHVKNLKKLEIHDCNLTDESSLDELLPLDHLEHLEIVLSKNIRLPAAVPHLTNLRIVEGDVRLPDSVSQWTSLTSLDLYGYNHQLPVDFKNILPQLTHLYISNCDDMRLPDKVDELITKLKTHVERIPHVVLNLSNLTELNLADNNIHTIPPGVFNLSNLKVLNLSRNNIHNIPPDDVFNLSNLTELNLSRNNTHDIPPGVFNLSNLSRLNLADNNINKVSCEVSKLIKLEEIDLKNNDIKELPVEIADMDQLNKIHLKGNFGMMKPPPEIYVQGTDSIKIYLKDLGKFGSNEKSLLTVQVVGETMSGKTSLCDTLIDGKSKLSGLDDRTKVVRICKWEPEQNISIHFYDFGGHGSYKVTTSFFLSPRTLVLIVYDVTKKDDDGFFTCFIGDWYDSILDLIPTAHVVLVGTHCEENMKMQIPALEHDIKKALEAKKQERRKVIDRRLKYLTNDNILQKRYKTEILVLKNELNHLKSVAIPLFWISSKTMTGCEDLQRFLVAECQEKRLVQPQPWSLFAESITSERDYMLYLPMKVVNDKYAELHPDVTKTQLRFGDSKDYKQQIINSQLSFFHDTGKVLLFNLKSGNDSGSQIVVHNIDMFVSVLREFFQHDISMVLQHGDDRFDDLPELEFEFLRDSFLSRGVMKMELFQCLISHFEFNEVEMMILVDLFKSFHLCFDVKYKDVEGVHLLFPWFLPAERPTGLDNKWPASSKDKFELGFKMQFALSIPQNFFQHAQVILHQHVGILYGDCLDYSSGAYACQNEEKILLDQISKTTVQLRVRSQSLVQASRLMTELKTKLEIKARDGWPGATCYTYIICAHCLCVGNSDQQVFKIGGGNDASFCYCKKGDVNVPAGLVLPVEDGDKDRIDEAAQFMEALKGRNISQLDTSVHIGKIKYNPSDEVLGRGCGTFVYRGTWDEKAAAIKKMLTTCTSYTEVELDNLRKVNHENVIRYYDWERDKDVLYIALELCAGTLQDMVADPTRFGNLQPKQLLYEMMKGLEHLHLNTIVHRDIKPSNVLISTPDVSGVSRAKVSDLGLSKAMKPGEDKLSGISGSVGTQGWIAPEMVKGAKDVTSAADIFSAGCLMYYVLTKGSHPFDPPTLQQYLISQGHYNLSHLSTKDCDQLCAAELVESMIQHKPSHRPSADVVLNHTLFWSYKKKAEFFQDVSDRILSEPVTSQTMIDLENHNVFNGDWLHYLCNALQTELTCETAKKGSSGQPNILYRKKAKYDKTKVKFLLRVIRNMKHHFHEQPVAIQTALGHTDELLMDYFLCAQRFPLLLVHVHRVMKAMKGDAILTVYY